MVERKRARSQLAAKMWLNREGQAPVKFFAIPSLRWRLVAVMFLAYTVVAVSSGFVEYYTQRENLTGHLRPPARSDAAIRAAGAVAPLHTTGSSGRTVLQNVVFSLTRADGVN